MSTGTLNFPSALSFEVSVVHEGVQILNFV